MRKPRYLASLALLIGIVVLMGAGYWWNRWPERTMERVVSLIEKRDFASIQRLFPDATWKVKGESVTLIDPADTHVELSKEAWQSQFSSAQFSARPREFSDRLGGRARYSLELRMIVGQVGFGSPRIPLQSVDIEFTAEKDRVFVSAKENYPREILMIEE